VFVEFGPQLEGLIHISELAWQRIDDPSDIIKVGEDIKAEIISIEGSKIFLSSKKLKDDPWKDIEKKYTVGQTVQGKILKVNPFGLFVELDKEIHGLAHISQLSNMPVHDIHDIAKPQTTMEFKIISIEPKDHRLGLALKMDDVKKEVPAEASKDELKETEDKAKESDETDKTDETKVSEKPSNQV